MSRTRSDHCGRRQLSGDIKGATRPDQTSASRADIQESRTALYRRIQNWRKIQDSYMPEAEGLRDDGEGGEG